jgi:hypothetical protein
MTSPYGSVVSFSGFLGWALARTRAQENRLRLTFTFTGRFLPPAWTTCIGYGLGAQSFNKARTAPDLPISPRSDGSTSPSIATTFGRQNRSNGASGSCGIRGQNSSMQHSVGFWEDSAMTQACAIEARDGRSMPGTCAATQNQVGRPLCESIVALWRTRRRRTAKRCKSKRSPKDPQSPFGKATITTMARPPSRMK